MAFFETTRSDGLTREGGSSLFNKLIDRFVAWKETRATQRALSALSDHELADIGLGRGDIDGAAARRY